MSTYRSSDTAAGPTIHRLRGKPLNVHAEHWWHRSSRCSVGDCVEVFKAGPVILVADSKLGALKLNQAQPWSVQEWQELLRAIRVAPDPFSVSHVAVDVIHGGPLLVKFGLDRHEKQTYDAAEWRAFFDGGQAGEFEPERLSTPAPRPARDGAEGALDSGSASSVQGVEVATGTGYGQGCGVPVPVAAELDSPAGRLDEDPAPPLESPSNLSDPAAGQPGATNDGDITWVEDPSLGEPQGPSKGAARRAGQGPVFADRPSVEAAGTGAPLVPVPVAESDAAHDCMYKRIYFEIADALDELLGPDEEDGCGQGLVAEIWHLAGRCEHFEDDPEADELLRQAAAPLVPTDGAS